MWLEQQRRGRGAAQQIEKDVSGEDNAIRRHRDAVRRNGTDQQGHI